MSQIRLDKCLALLGVGTRTEVKGFIRKGAVLVRGQRITDPSAKFDAENAEIQVGATQYVFKSSRTIMMNKAAGVLTAARDPKQKTVMDTLPEIYVGLGCMPVGRLDKDTTGLLILTSDGQLAHRLISPLHEVGKVYEAVIDGPFTDMDREAFERGIEIRDSDGTFTAKPAKVRVMENGEHESIVRLSITEGKYHQVKRMFAMRGRTVTGLRRLAIGRLWLDHLEPGAFRELGPEEIALLEQDGDEL